MLGRQFHTSEIFKAAGAATISMVTRGKKTPSKKKPASKPVRHLSAGRQKSSKGADGTAAKHVRQGSEGAGGKSFRKTKAKDRAAPPELKETAADIPAIGKKATLPKKPFNSAQDKPAVDFAVEKEKVALPKEKNIEFKRPGEKNDSVLAQISPAIEAKKALLPEEMERTAMEVAGSESATALTDQQLYEEQLKRAGKKAGREADGEDLYNGDEEYKAIAGGVAGARRVKSRTASVVLVVLVIMFAVSAVGGIYMFMNKNMITSDLSFFVSLFWKEKSPAVVQEPSEGAIPEISAPSSVGLVFTLGFPGEEPVGDAPFVESRVIETDVRLEDSFQTTGTKISPDAKSKGTVTIINETDNSYTFVVRTRVLSEGGVLLRFDKATPIPANGSVETAVTADEPGPESDIGPDTFTIPGLPESLQEVIYATSDEPMFGGAGTVKAVSVNDIAEAKADLKDRLFEEAEANFGVMVSDNEYLERRLFADEELEFVSEDAGTEGASFEAELSLNVKTMPIPEDVVAGLLLAQMEEVLNEGLDSADYGLGAPSYTIEAFDTELMKAEVRVEAPLTSAE